MNRKSKIKARLKSLHTIILNLDKYTQMHMSLLLIL